MQVGERVKVRGQFYEDWRAGTVIPDPEPRPPWASARVLVDGDAADKWFGRKDVRV